MSSDNRQIKDFLLYVQDYRHTIMAFIAMTPHALMFICYI